jgi:cyclomaltodextrinase / maltogenic alpha-amylase / neopullulanase
MVSACTIPTRIATFACCLSLALGFVGCSDPVVPEKPKSAPDVVGLFPPLDLGMDSTVLILRDYFPHGEFPDSLIVPTGLVAKADPQAGTLLLTRGQDSLAWLSSLGMRFGTHQFDVLLRRSRKQRVVFSLDGAGKPWTKVQVAGEINSWNPGMGELQRVGDKWQTSFILNPGAYQYQYVTDGTWGLDPGNPNTVANGIGGFNSEVVVGTPQALATPQHILSTYDLSEGGLRIFLKGAPSYHPEDILVFHDNQRIDPAGSDPTEGGILVKIKIPEQAATQARSHLRIWTRTAGGWSNDLLIPLAKGDVLQDPKRLGPADQHTNILYFMMVDRFANGDTSNDHPLTDPEVHPRANYHGGDLAGIVQRLQGGYFDSLGINMIWLSPIVQNPDSAFREWPEPHRKYSGYHGYWPVTSGTVDYRFGKPSDLDSLVAIAHRGGKKVILDYVANHVHENHPIMRQHPDWKTPLHIDDSTLNVRRWDDHRLTTWFDTFLPSLDHAKPEVIEWQVDTAVWWITRYKLDGFRHDATKHIEEAFWRRLTEKLRQDYILKEQKPLFQIGETFGSRELIGSYVGAGLLDAQFDFNHYFDIRGTFAQDGQNLQDNILASFKESEAYYGSHSLMGNITGNHDMARFISYAGNGLKFNEDPKVAGWTRDITVYNPVGYQRLRMLTAYLAAIPGLPVIYYGDEIGMPGGDDPDNRRDMRFSGLSPEELATKRACAKILQLRRSHMATLYGETDMRLDGRVLTVHRHYFADDLWFVFNLDNAPVKFKSPAYGLKPLVNGSAMAGAEIGLLPWGFEVLGR